MAKKTRKLEEVSNEEILVNNITENTDEMGVQVDTNDNNQDELTTNPYYDMESNKLEDTVKEDTIKEQEEIVTENKNNNPYKKKMTQRFFGNYIWNGMVSDIVIPKQK